MTYLLMIPGRLPGLNEYTNAQRTHWAAGAKMKKRAQTEICWHIKQQLAGVKIDRPVAITYLWVEANRRRDRDNVASAKKFIQDALVEMRVLANDGWWNVVRSTDGFKVDKLNPRVEVTIEEVG